MFDIKKFTVAAVLGVSVLYVGAANAATIGVFGDRNERVTLGNVLTGQGDTVTVNSTLAGLGALSQYDTLWHVGAFAPFTGAEQTALSSYITGGGGVHLTGERPCCDALNNSIDALLAGLVGAMTVGNQGDISGPYAFNASAPGMSGLSVWTPSASGGIAGLSGDDVLATGAGGVAVGGIWDENDINGGVGRITLLMDVNWFSNSGGNRDLNIDTIQTFLESGSGVTPVPEPATLGLFGLGLIGLGLAARRRKTH